MMRAGRSITARKYAPDWSIGLLVGISLGVLSVQVNSQSLRDPTVPPAQAGFSSAAPDAKPSGVEPGAMAIIVRDGRPFLVVGTRLYARGQKLGQARIERISETEVWLREGKVLRKVSPFVGIERRTVTPSSKKLSQ